MKNAENALSDWLSIEEARKFLNYKATQMNKFLRDHPQVKTSTVGRRRFVSKSSLNDFLHGNAS